MDFSLTPDQVLIRDAVREVCARFPGQYWRDREANGEYPTQFVMEMTRLGWLSVLIPEEYGGGGQGVTEAGLILEDYRLDTERGRFRPRDADLGVGVAALERADHMLVHHARGLRFAVRDRLQFRGLKNGERVHDSLGACNPVAAAAPAAERL